MSRLLAERSPRAVVQRFGPLAINGLGAASTVLAGLLIARRLGLSAFGLYSTGLLASRFASAAGQVGLGQVCVRLASDDALPEAERRQRVRTAVLLAALFLVIAAVILAAIIAPILSQVLEHHIEEDDFPVFVRRVVWTFALSVPLHGLSVVIGQAWAGQGRAALSMALQTAIQPGVLLVLILIAPFGWGGSAQTTAAMAVTGSAVSFVVALATLPRLTNARDRVTSGHARELLREGSLLMPSALAQIGGLTFAVLALGIVADSEAAGLYSLSARVVSPVNVVVAAMAAQLSKPFGNALSLRRDEAARNMAVHWARRMLSVALPYAVVVFVAAEPLLGLIRDDWSQAANVVRFLLIGSITSIAFGPVLLGLTLIDRGVDVSRSVVLGLCVGIVGIVILGWQFGAVGAGIATMVQLLVTNAYASHRLQHHRGFRTWVINRTS